MLTGKKTATTVLYIKAGNTDVPIDTGLMSIDMTGKVRYLVGKVKAERSDLQNFPMEVGETLEDWQERIGGEADAEAYIRKSDESIEDHINRISLPKFDAQEMAQELINGLSLLFNGKDGAQVDDDQFQKAHWPTIKDQLDRIFTEAGIWVPEYSKRARK